MKHEFKISYINVWGLKTKVLSEEFDTIMETFACLIGNLHKFI